MLMSPSGEPTSLKAFVLSPIDGEYDEVYSQLIKPALQDEGFEVARADELDLQNILAAIVQGITSADLVVAEISTRNPNVMYELGIAHALGRPVVILTQDIDQVPFDLRSYRMVKYSPHFTAVQSLVESLHKVGAAVRDGTLKYSSPVQDFSELMQPAHGEGAAAVVDEPDEPSGLLDHLFDNEARLEALSTGTTAVSAATEEIGERFTQRTSEIEDLADPSTPGHTARALAVLRKTAKDLEWYADELRKYDDLLSEVTPAISESLVEVFKIAALEDPNERESAEAFLGSIDGLGAGIAGGLEGIGSMRETLQGLREQRLNRDFSRAARRATEVMDSIIDRLTTFQADLTRGAAVLQERLDEGVGASD